MGTMNKDQAIVQAMRETQNGGKRYIVRHCFACSAYLVVRSKRDANLYHGGIEAVVSAASVMHV